MKRLTIALLVLFALIMADVAITLVGLSLGASDLNPLYYGQGFQTFLTVKLISATLGIITYLAAYHYIEAKWPKYIKVLWILVAFLIGFYSYVVVNNLIVLMTLAST